VSAHPRSPDLQAEQGSRSPRPVLLATAALVAVGLLLVLSGADTPAARRWGRAPADFLNRQVTSALLGCAAVGALALAGRLTRLAALPLGLLTAILCALTLTPQIGVAFGGARRQVDFLGVQFQPTVLFCALVPVLLSTLLVRARRREAALAWTIVGSVAGVCLLQPNFGHLGTLLATALGTLWGLGRRRALRWVGALFLSAGPLALCFPYVRWRIQSFLDPNLTRDTRTLQEIVREAGPLGAGLGLGGDKSGLSAAPTDYLFALSLEEIGWVGALAIVALLILLSLAVWSLAPEADGDEHPHPQRVLARGVAGGTAAFIAFPGLVHVLVCLRLFPVTGIHLPLVSYSGSGVLAVLIALGFLVALTRDLPPRQVQEGQGPDRPAPHPEPSAS
jgi:cell division protein FtsW (lipid II flippase)